MILGTLDALGMIVEALENEGHTTRDAAEITASWFVRQSKVTAEDAWDEAVDQTYSLNVLSGAQLRGLLLDNPYRMNGDGTEESE